uniref:Cytochrome c oxidase assembly protein COX19 n=1 Tax=Geospiza parvula TaxID=87175 RepID=A0A8C3M811_GEOPR
MSTAMNFSSKSFTPRPPDKGAFPLDHFGECSAFKERFMQCLRQSGYESSACRQSAMAYLECRMDRRVPRHGGDSGEGRGKEPAVTQGVLAMKDADAPVASAGYLPCGFRVVQRRGITASS